MLAMIEVDWFDAKKLTVEQRNTIREHLPQMNMPQEDAAQFFPTREFLADLTTDGPLLLDLGLSFAIKRFKGCYFLGESGESYTGRRPKNGYSVTLQVAIPNLALFAVNEVQLLEDACTDELQRRLEEGWRILAVCPPAAQRRPDYILGRSPETMAAQAKS